MPKEEWGVKRVCPNCSTRFYDLQRDPMTCPSCAHGFSLESLLAGKNRTLIQEKASAKKAVPEDDLVEDDDDVIDDDDDESSDVDLGDDVLDDDDDDNMSLDDIADMSGSDDDEG